MAKRQSISFDDKSHQAWLKYHAGHPNISLSAYCRNALCNVVVQVPDDLRPALKEYLDDFPGLTLERAYNLAMRNGLTAMHYPRSLDGQITVSDIPPPTMAHKIDKNGKLLDVSPGWLQTLGYSRVQVIRLPLAECMTKESQDELKEHLNIPIKDRPESFKREMICGNGDILPVTITIKRRDDWQGNCQYVMSILSIIEE